MYFDEKKSIMTIMAKRHPKTGETTSAEMKPEVVKTEDGEIDGRHEAMQDFLAGHADKSPQKMAEAMANFMDLHAAHTAKAQSSDDKK